MIGHTAVTFLVLTKSVSVLPVMRIAADYIQTVPTTPAGTRAGIDQRWVTVPVTGQSHGRATEPIAKGL